MGNTCFVIVGPTAVGKTAFAIALAKYFSTKIISADSRQCYTELNIGVAKPAEEELQAVPHYFINSHSINDTVNAVVFEQYALQKVAEIFKNHNTAVIVGGTGLYVKAFCDGIDEIPAVDVEIRKNIIAQYTQHGLQWLQNEVKKHDPIYFANGENKNPQRMMRALEIILSTRKSITEFKTFTKKERPFTIVKIGLQLPKEQLHKNINHRVDTMLQQGLLNEVESLTPFKNYNALQTVGYKEIFSYLNGDIQLNEAIAQIKINTRHYAKRQMTWFIKDEAIKWINPLSFLAEESLAAFATTLHR